MIDPKSAPTPTSIQKKMLVPVAIGGVVAVGLIVAHHLILAILVGVILFGRIAFAKAFANVPNGVKAEPAGPALSEEAKSLRRQLGQAKYLENIDTKLAERAINQFEQILDRQKQFSKSLDLRFERSEMAYERYNTAVSQVCSAVIDQLKRIGELLNQLSAMNLKQVEQQGLTERLEMGKKLEANLSDYFSKNEAAITELDRLILALNEVKTSKSNPGAGSSGDYEALLGQLQELAERAKKYSL